MTTKDYLKIYNRYNSSPRYLGRKEDLRKIRSFNKHLIKKYPWLMPRNRWTDTISKDYDYSYTELDEMPEGWRIAFGDQMVEEIHRQLVKFNYVNDFRITQIKEKWGSLQFYCGATPVGKLSEAYTVFSRKGSEVLAPKWDVNKYCLREDHSEHYISYFDRDKVNMTFDEIDAYNKEAIHYYRLYEIEEKCTIPEIISKYEKLSSTTCIQCGKPAVWESRGWVSPYCDDCAKNIYNKIRDNEFKYTKNSSKLIKFEDEFKKLKPVE